MANVVFDFTRLASVFGRSIEKPALFLADLARLIEAILLYEAVYVTEPLESLSADESGAFDLTKREIYEPLLGGVIAKMPPEVEGEALSIVYREARREFGSTGHKFCLGDLAAFEDVKASIRAADFMFDWSTEYDDIGILYSIERVRVLLMSAHIMKAPYDPIAFRIPIVQQMAPANLENPYLKAYRKFESDLFTYVREVCGDSAALSLPLLLYFVLNESNAADPDSVFAIALQLRDDPLIVRLREILGSVIHEFGAWNLPRAAQLSRMLTAESEKIRSKLSGEIGGAWQFRLKPGKVPVDVGYDLKSLLQRVKDRQLYTAVTNLSAMSKVALESCVAMRPKIEALFNMTLPSADLQRLASPEWKPQLRPEAPSELS